MLVPRRVRSLPPIASSPRMSVVGREVIEGRLEEYVRATALLVAYPLGAIMGWPTLGERARELVLTLIERWAAAAVDIEATELAS